MSAEGVSGDLTVVLPFEMLRMTWKRPDWDRPSRLQIRLLPAASGKTTVAIRQEMLEDVYIRELMRLFRDKTLRRIENGLFT